MKIYHHLRPNTDLVAFYNKRSKRGWQTRQRNEAKRKLKNFILIVTVYMLFMGGIHFYQSSSVTLLYVADIKPLRLGFIKKDFFTGYQDLKEICACETTWNKEAEPVHSINGAVVINKDSVIGTDVGICQINTYYHEKRAKQLGYDLYELEDNIAFAKLLFNEQGVTPWKWSKKCHNK